MKKLTSITIVMPVCNGMPYLEEAVESVLNQHFVNWRLIISDNGSTDDSRSYLTGLERKGDARIQIYFQDQNLGIFGNLNFMLQKVDTDLVHILCADDFLLTNSSLCQIVETCSWGDERLGAIRWNVSGLLGAGVPDRVQSEVGQLYFFLFGNLMGSLSNVTCKKDALIETGSFNQSYPYVGDFEYWARMSLQAEIKISSLNLLHIRDHPKQASFYLNKHGEKYLQQSLVTSAIYRRIPSPTWIAKILLKFAGTLVYDSQFRAHLVIAALNGNQRGLEALNRAASQSVYCFSPFFRNLLFLFSIGGKLGKTAWIKAALKANLLGLRGSQNSFRAASLTNRD
jgi:glycosyltransferase involved in cell wall biosynthesis